jgi:hypothetical protein
MSEGQNELGTTGDEGWEDDLDTANDEIRRTKHEDQYDDTTDTDQPPTPGSDWDWNQLVDHPAYAEHARSKASEVEQPEFDLIPVTETQLQPFKDSKDQLHADTKQANVRVRPEVKTALRETVRNTEDFFEGEPTKTHVYEALLIAGMLNMDLTMGILSTYGYGLNEHV